VPLTDEDKTEIGKIFGAELVKAIGAEGELTKALGGQIRKIVPGMLKEQSDSLKTLTDKLSSFETKVTELDEAAKAALDDADKKDKSKKGGETDPEVAKQLKALSDKLAAAEKKREEAERKATETEDKRKRSTIRSESIKTLVELGVDPSVAEVVHDSLAPNLSLDDAGLVLGKRTVDGTDENVPLKDYHTAYLKSDVGKHFVKTTPAGGSGADGNKKKTSQADGPVAGNVRDVLRGVISKVT